MSLVIRTKLKEVAQGFNISSDFADALDKKAEELVKSACERAKANGRKTVMSKDL